MDRDSLTFRTFRNISYSVLGYVWPIVFALFITPIIIFRLGVKVYGIYLFVNTIISLLGLLDLGISAAVTKYLASYYGQKNWDGISRLIRSANSLFLTVGIFGLLISAIIAFWGPALLATQLSAYR